MLKLFRNFTLFIVFFCTMVYTNRQYLTMEVPENIELIEEIKFIEDDDFLKYYDASTFLSNKTNLVYDEVALKAKIRFVFRNYKDISQKVFENPPELIA